MITSDEAAQRWADMVCKVCQTPIDPERTYCSNTCRAADPDMKIASGRGGKTTAKRKHHRAGKPATGARREARSREMPSARRRVVGDSR